MCGTFRSRTHLLARRKTLPYLLRFQQGLSLDGAAINLELLREDARAELNALLDRLPGSKCLVLDSFIGGLLNHVVPEGSRLLKEKGVVYFRELRSGLSGLGGTAISAAAGGTSVDPDQIIYMVRPTIPNMKFIADQIHTRTKQGGAYDFRYKVFFVPQRTLVCQQILKEENVLRKIDVGDFPLDLVPFEKDVLSLELDQLFRECLLDADYGSLTTVARSLQKLQAIFGTIPHVKAKGSSSKQVLKKLLRLSLEEMDPQQPDDESCRVPSIDTLVMLDRGVDLASALVTPLTYEGLIDELIGIGNGFVKLDPDLAGVEESPGGAGAGKKEGGGGAAGGGSSAAQGGAGGKKKQKQVAIPLNSNDALFGVIRDLNVEALGPFLQEKAKEIRASYSSFRSNKDQSIGEIHDFVKRIPGLTQNYKSATQHINIAELIKKTTDSPAFRQRWQTERSMLEGDINYEMLEEAINMQEPVLRVLRLLCLQSVTNGGIRSNKYDTLKREIVQTYGYEHLFTLTNLEKIGLLHKREASWGVDSGSSTWNTLRRSLRLINDSVDVHTPGLDDIGYVSSGYCPLSVRLVQAAARAGGWGNASVAEALRLLPGLLTEFDQSALEPVEDLEEAVREYAEAGGAAAAPQSQVGMPTKKVMLVYFIGGMTFMEIAALRFLSRQKEFPFQIVMATTQITNGDKVVESLMPGFENNLMR